MRKVRLRPEIIHLPMSRLEVRDSWLLSRGLYLIGAAVLLFAFALGSVLL